MTTPTPTKYPRLPIASAAQMSLKMTVDGQPAVVVLGVRIGGNVISVPQAEAWRNAAWEAFRPLIVNTANCDGAVIRTVSGTADQVIELGAPPNPSGNSLGTPTLQAGATLIKWSTATGGRSGKGRTFLPGLMRTNLSQNGRTYEPTYRTQVGTQVAAYLGHAGLSGNGLVPAILSFRTGQAYPITAGALASVCGLQRRRMR